MGLVPNGLRTPLDGVQVVGSNGNTERPRRSEPLATCTMLRSQQSPPLTRMHRTTCANYTLLTEEALDIILGYRHLFVVLAPRPSIISSPSTVPPQELLFPLALLFRCTIRNRLA